MNENEINELINKRITEAKLEVTEKRLNFLMWLAGAALAIFGVAFPLWQSNRSADKVDTALIQMRQENEKTSEVIRSESRTSSESLARAMPEIRSDLRADLDAQSQRQNIIANKVDIAIQDMRREFKELAGTQLRKPNLECFSDGLSLDGKIIQVLPTQENVRLTIKNHGDAPAKAVRIRFYTNIVTSGHLRGDYTQWNEVSSFDEPGYKYAFESQARSLDPKEILPIDLFLILSEYSGVKTGDYPALIKIFYEQPEPRRYAFTIKIKM